MVTTLKKPPTKQDLLALVERLYEEGVSWSCEDEDQDPLKITEAVFRTAKYFIEKLPEGIPVPKVSPNGEGRLLMVWGTETHETMIVIAEWKLHAVTMIKGNISEETIHFENKRFERNTDIPVNVIDAIRAMYSNGVV